MHGAIWGFYYLFFVPLHQQKKHPRFADAHFVKLNLFV